MTQLSSVRARLKGRRMALVAAFAAPSAAAVPLRALTLLGLAVMLGLATGFLELAMHFARRHFINTSSLGALQLNRHAAWMVPLSDTLIFGICGLLLAGLAALSRARWVKMAGVYALSFLWALAFLMALRGLTTLACSALAAGIAFRMTLWIRAHSRGTSRIVRAGVPGLVGLVVVLSCLSASRGGLAHGTIPAAAPGSPNVLLVVLDTVRAESLSLYGYGRETTPELTKLAKRGARFDHARTTASWTLPSHASMFTGRWAYELSTRRDRALDAAFPTLAEYLRDRGYATAGFVANTFFCNTWFGLDRGFVHYEDIGVNLIEILRSSDMGRWLVRKVAPETCSRDRVRAYFNRKDAPTINRDVLAWLSSRPAGRPFFAFLNYYDAHDPYLTAQGAPRRFGLRPTTRAEIAALRNWLHVDYGTLPPRTLEVARDGYDDCLAYLDNHVGRLFAALESRGLLQNTVVIVTADHGELFGEHGAFGHGSHVYRGAVQVPLLVLAPGRIPAGSVVANPVSLRDLPATVVELLGMEQGSPFPGRSLARFWGPQPTPSRNEDEFLLSETADELSTAKAGATPVRALAYQGKVYIRNKDKREELYDLATDSAELHDLAQTEVAQTSLQVFRDKMRQIDTASANVR